MSKTFATLASAGAVFTGAAMTGGGVAAADTTTGLLDGVTSSVTCTAAGEAVVTFTYPGGIPAGTRAMSNVDYFKYDPVSADAALGATSGTVTYSAAALTRAVSYNDVMSAGLATSDGRVHQAEAFSPTLCGASGAASSDRAGVAPTISFGPAFCRDGQAYSRVATGNPDSEARAFSASNGAVPYVSTETITAAPGVSAQDVALTTTTTNTGPATGSVTLTVSDDYDRRVLTSVTLTMPDCSASVPAPAVSFTVASWDCTTMIPTLTYRNDSGEPQVVQVRRPGTTTSLMTLNVPVGTTNHQAGPGLDGTTLEFVDADSQKVLSTLTFDASADCAEPTPSETPTPTDTTNPTPTADPTPSETSTTAPTPTDTSSTTPMPTSDTTLPSSTVDPSGPWTSPTPTSEPSTTEPTSVEPTNAESTSGQPKPGTSSETSEGAPASSSEPSQTHSEGQGAPSTSGAPSGTGTAAPTDAAPVGDATGPVVQTDQESGRSLVEALAAVIVGALAVILVAGRRLNRR